MKGLLKYIFFYSFCFLTTFNLYSQRVGVVLSGGGATGLAHVGLLMALEEAEIPIDYITGTSAGALVGAMYASGYSPEQIKMYILSEDFGRMSAGELTADKRFMLRRRTDDASMLNVPFSRDSIFQKSLPTNYMTPSLLDYEMLRIFGATSASVGEDFDQLFVPFRCVASDIRRKESVVFRSGKLNLAIRASMTYPFYMNPIKINNVLLFDGGLYNNFPADVVCDEFDVDYIVGSKVTYNADPPKEDDLISQITNMLVTPSSFELPCKEGIVISPQTNVKTFEFSESERAINEGYKAGVLAVDSIRISVKRRVSKAELTIKRNQFLSKIEPIKVSSVEATTKGEKPIDFVKKSIVRDTLTEPIDFDKFTKRYFRAYASPQIKYLLPSIARNKDGSHAMKIDVTKEKPFLLSAGGHFSSRPVNTGFIGVSYHGLSDGALTLFASSYFGKFYGSTHLKADVDIPSVHPLRVSPYFTMNRWDYFRSFATFFEDVKPSFLVQNEIYYGTKISVPMGNVFKAEMDFRSFELEDEYYQTQNFTNADTADVTNFSGQTAYLAIESNTLNRKQWASSGHYLRAQVRYVQGIERSVSGSTSPFEYDIRNRHQWINITAEGQFFPISKGVFRLGLHGKGVVNSQSLFANYTASILAMTEFSPLPDVKTFFFEEYRAPQYIGFGANFIASINDVFDVRLDPYIFQPFRQIVRFEDNMFGYSDLFERGTFMAGGSVIYHSPVGPLRFTTNYFPVQDKPFTFQLSFGYVMFNDRAVR